MSEEKQGEGEKKPNNRNRNRNRNRNKNRNKNKGPNKSNVQGRSEQRGEPQSKNKKKSNNRRPKRKYKLSKEDAIYNKYLTLMEHHMSARKKYFALFDRADIQQKSKLEKQFTISMDKVRQFEEGLDTEDKKIFLDRVNGLTLDHTYSSNHDIDPSSFEVAPSIELHAEPHYLETQKSSTYKDDTEESVGSLEDYQAYKGV